MRALAWICTGPEGCVANTGVLWGLLVTWFAVCATTPILLWRTRRSLVEKALAALGVVSLATLVLGYAAFLALLGAF